MTQLIRPTAPAFDIRCDVGDATVANLAMHFVFFFERRLGTAALTDGFAVALQRLPLFAGRMGLAGGRMSIRCRGQGAPLRCASSDRTLAQAIGDAVHDRGLSLVDPVQGPAARWGLSPVCRVLITHLADDATAIGFSWHHALGDMQTLMIFMNTWAAASAGEPLPEPVLVANRAAYLDARLPPDGATEPGVRCLELSELARSALYLAKDARKQRTLSVYFGDDELARMREYYGTAQRLSVNDVVCGHVSEALMECDPGVDRRTLAIAVNARTRCGLDPMLVGNVITTLHVPLRRGEAAAAIAARIRHGVNHFADEHCDLRINQRFLDGVGPWRAARCVSTAFDPVRWNPLVSNQSGFGAYRVRFEGTFPTYCTMVPALPVAGLGALLEGAYGRGLVFLMSLPPKEFAAMRAPELQRRLRRFRRPGDDIPRLHAEAHG